MPSESATTAAARRAAARERARMAASASGARSPIAAGSSGQGSRISHRKGVPRAARASSAGMATVTGVVLATTRSHPPSASPEARAA